MNVILEHLVGFIWNWPVALLCLFGGLFFTFRLKLIQFFCFPHAIGLVSGKYDNPNETGQITHFQALSAALSATIGLGNIAGVAIAIAVGGPGAVFWMWIIGLFGMATKYIECALGTHYREVDEKTGEVHGGPMYYIVKGLGKKFKPLAVFYAVAICLASFGAAALFQSNQAAAALHTYYSVPKFTTGFLLFLFSFTVIVGGIKRIGNVASKIVPFMCVVYIGCALLICLLNIHLIPAAFQVILHDAFTGHAAAGGFVPVLFAGIRRAIFSNEAGLGSAAIAHAAVKTDYPIREGIVASLGPLIDTVIVCSATAFVIILSGNFGTHMYQPAEKFTLSFEGSHYERLFNSAWHVSDKANIPEDTDVFRTHVDGDSVLAYKGSSMSHAPVSFFNIKNPSNIVRLSYFKQKGDMRIKIYSDSHDLLGEIGSDGQFEGDHIRVEHFDSDSTWQSALIHLNNVASEKLTFELIPVGTDVHWFIDSIQPVEKLNGIGLTTQSFDHFFKGFGSIFITFSVLFFAFSTIITWSYYGETSFYYLFGGKGVFGYKLFFVLFVLVGSVTTLDSIINFSDAMIGLLVVPNIIALILLSGKVKGWTIDYFKKLKAGEIKPYSA